ncbi:hypothetical protein MKQ68_02065 [Chitinophaga horti]|uniref:Uncharacterized protein n=1 Tax=Chitinophaga horti TaxID=2920382 RepID=A0ABY6J2Z5_9BACT|nr:hypothetical protein [Chitinophaga horti]UYQ93880.1 hypothetical protein MKQ68_02065 [Chitinophaga horti]
MKLKPVLFAAFASLVLSVNANAQGIKDLFNSDTQLTYFGIDFTQMRLIGDEAANQDDIVEKQLPALNDLIVNEPKKFKLADAFHKNRVDTDLEESHKKNGKINADKIKSSKSADFHRLKPADIDAVVKTYNFADYKGLGILFVCEAFSKTEKSASYYVTIIDLATKKVLLTERMTGDIGRFGGFTFRNYWANPVKEILDSIGKTQYKAWRAKYAGE